MWNVPSKERLEKIPKLYSTEDIPIQEKLFYLHFFIGGCDWYAAEYDNGIFWGFVILNGDLINAEWGYFSFDELIEIKLNGFLEIDWELEDHWKVRSASKIKNICEANNWSATNPDA